MDLVALFITMAAGAVGALVGSFIMWSFVGPRVVRKSIGPEIGSAIYDWLTTPSLETGKMKEYTDEDGKVRKEKEIITPLEQLMIGAGDIVYFKIMSKMGVIGRKKQVAEGDIVADLSNPNNPFAQAVGGISPTLLNRALKDGDYIPILLDMFKPQIEKFLNSKLADTSSSGGVKW